MEVIVNPPIEKWGELLKRPAMESESLEAKVGEILNEVKTKGDQAVRKYSKLFDHVDIDELQVSREEILGAEKLIDNELKKAIQLAKSNIERFHRQQVCNCKRIETTPGVKCWQKGIAIEKVGLYIPGGTAPLFSTVLMLAIPASIAGCKEIVLCSPPREGGKINPIVLYCAHISGVTKVFKVGGVQAIAAMAYGTKTVPAVYKIFGPGNQYVTCAKQIVSRQGISIDMPAGPSEVAVIADESSNPEWIASDLLAQAEHGPDSQVILTIANETLIKPIEEEIEKQLKALPRKDIAIQALKNSKIFVMSDKKEMMGLINAYAPEHLIIATDDASELAEQVINAGSVFIGHLTPESAGDYASGTNHTLPTNGYARFYSGLNLDSFVKKVTFQQISEYGLFNIGYAIEKMAELEELQGHKNAVTLRLNSMLKK